MKSRRVARMPCGVDDPLAGVPASLRCISQGGAWSCSGMIGPPCLGTIVVSWLWRVLGCSLGETRHAQIGMRFNQNSTPAARIFFAHAKRWDSAHVLSGDAVVVCTDSAHP